MNNYDMIINFKVMDGDEPRKRAMTEQEAKDLTSDMRMWVQMLERLNPIKVDSIIVAQGVSKEKV